MSGQCLRIARLYGSKENNRQRKNRKNEIDKQTEDFDGQRGEAIGGAF